MTAVHQRPVWLFSMDSDNFYAAPTTTACLKAYYLKYSADPGCSDIELIHFRDADAVSAWHEQWRQQYLPVAEAAVAAGVTPVAGFSFYTWNAAEFLELVRLVKADCPGILVFAGGPHVQQAEDYLFGELPAIPAKISFLVIPPPASATSIFRRCTRRFWRAPSPTRG